MGLRRLAKLCEIYIIVGSGSELDRLALSSLQVWELVGATPILKMAGTSAACGSQENIYPGSKVF